jgi:hypothetical protein
MGNYLNRSIGKLTANFGRAVVIKSTALVNLNNLIVDDNKDTAFLNYSKKRTPPKESPLD